MILKWWKYNGTRKGFGPVCLSNSGTHLGLLFMTVFYQPFWLPRWSYWRSEHICSGTILKWWKFNSTSKGFEPIYLSNSGAQFSALIQLHMIVHLCALRETPGCTYRQIMCLMVWSNEIELKVRWDFCLRAILTSNRKGEIILVPTQGLHFRMIHFLFFVSFPERLSHSEEK